MIVSHPWVRAHMWDVAQEVRRDPARGAAALSESLLPPKELDPLHLIHETALHPCCDLLGGSLCFILAAPWRGIAGVVA